MKQRNHKNGYGGLGILIFAAVIGVFAYFFFFPSPQKTPSSSLSGDCVAGREPKEYKEVTFPAIGKDAGLILDIDGNVIEDEVARFVLIREKVPIYGSQLFNSGYSDHLTQFGRTPDIPDYSFYIPSKAIEHDIVGETQISGRKKASIYLKSESFIVTAPTDKGNKPIPYAKIPNPDPEDSFVETIVLVDVYQEKSKYEQAKNGQRPYTYDEIFACDEIVDTAMIVNPLPIADAPRFNKTELEFIEPSEPPKFTFDQLQLHWFLVKNDLGNGIWMMHCKPAVYLYPEKEMTINVKVAISHGSFIYTDPLYPKDTGWNVIAKPNGEITYLSENLADSTGKINYPSNIFPYLYYEARIPDHVIEKPTQGFVRKQTDLSSFFDDLLPRLGLNEKETSEFKGYWLKALPESKYYFIGIISEENLDAIEPLTITPTQDTTIRIALFFEALSAFRIVVPPTIHTPNRTGFTVVEWGGMIKRDNNHPFTCSE